MDETGSKYLRGGDGILYGNGNGHISFLETATNFLWVLNMSANMARQGGQVQIEQSNMLLTLNMAKMGKGGFLHTGVEETQYLIKKPRAEVREENKKGVEFLGQRKVMAAMKRHPAMVGQNQMDGCLPLPNGTE